MLTDRTHSSRAGMTMLEIMIVVAIISLLAAIAIPAFRKAREQSQNAAFISDLRTFVAAFEQRLMEERGVPADAAPGVYPPGMESYMGNGQWQSPTSIGGNWDWEPNAVAEGHGVGVVGTTAPDSRFLTIDERIDDGDLDTGLGRRLAAGKYMSIVE